MEFWTYYGKSIGVNKVVCMEDKKILDKTVKNILAPSLNGFLLWCLRETCRRGIKRLYFLARDGYLMYRCAQIYVQALNLPIECRYFCCSRYSLRIPMYHLDMETALDYICRGGIEVTLEKILSRGGIEKEDQEKFLSKLDMREERTQIIPYPCLKEIRQKLKDCPLFIESVEKISKGQLEAFHGYAEQEGMFDKISMAIVDSGWVGSMGKELNRLLKFLGKEEEIPGYYWGLYELPANVRRENYHCYYFSPEKGLRRKVHFNNNLFEGIFSAPHGMTLGYLWEEEEWKPIFSHSNAVKERFLKRTEEILIEYTKVQAAKIKVIQTDGLESVNIEKIRKSTEVILGRFMGWPDKEEAELFGSLPFSDDMLEHEGEVLAQKLTETELKENHVWRKLLHMTGINQSYVRESPWYEGSAVLYGKRPRYHIIMYHLYKWLLYFRKERHFCRKYCKKQPCCGKTL